jgi:hypothetical protein
MRTQQGEKHYCAPFWHMDCLGTVAILALGFNKRQRKRLSGRYGLTEDADSGDPISIYQDLHKACHCYSPLVKSISKDLDGRFREVLRQVASSEATEIRSMETPFPLPMLWATLNDRRDEVRVEGRRRLNSLFLQALNLTLTVRENQEDLAPVVRALTHENNSLKARISELERDLERIQRRSEVARPVPVEPPRPVMHDPGATSRIAGRLEREVRKLSHALKKERERSNWLESELRELRTCALESRSAETGPLEDSEMRQEACLLEYEGDSGCGRAAGRTSTIVCKGDLLCPERGECTRDCPLRDLTVAILGGSEGALPAYRCMVGELGGECLYHNGCLRQGADRLKRVIGQADIVVCITSVNSHAAVKFAKNICKRSGKRLLVTKESGIHSLKEMLQQTVH